MPTLPDYKEAFASYRNGFFVGAFTGIVLCIWINKPLYVLPVILGILFGGVAFERKMKEDGNN